MATARFTEVSRENVVAGIKAMTLRGQFGRTDEATVANITFNPDQERLESTNQASNGNIMTAIIPRGKTLGDFSIQGLISDSWDTLFYFNLEGQGVNLTTDFVQHVRGFRINFSIV